MITIPNEFGDLNRLNAVAREPVIREKKIEAQPTVNQFGEFFGDIRRSNTGFSTPLLENLEACTWSGELDGIPPFSTDKLQHVLCHLKARKAQDADGFVAEMFGFGGADLSKCLLRILNSMLCTGNFEPTWRSTLLLMLPKTGGTTQANNWKPIAVLKITYILEITI